MFCGPCSFSEEGGKKNRRKGLLFAKANLVRFSDLCSEPRRVLENREKKANENAYGRPQGDYESGERVHDQRRDSDLQEGARP